MKMARWRCVCRALLIRHNVTPPEVTIRRRCRLNFSLRLLIVCYPCQRNRLPPDYRLQTGGNHGIAFHALAGAQLF
ncbi:hypothetical protein M1734_19695, partial [Salmonella enterica subsp. enterica serovar Yoruba]|uniref:hypothetical protein n=1 Tax=Salmonella enterica TaxID=28901 RepID=UPI0021B330B0